MLVHITDCINTTQHQWQWRSEGGAGGGGAAAPGRRPEGGAKIMPKN